MSDIQKARELFRSAGLTFPNLPDPLALALEEKGRWLFATRDLPWSPYSLRSWLREAPDAQVDYAVLAHSGHGVNSYALQYYVVRRRLRVFLFLGLGGAYMDAARQTRQANLCIGLADELLDLEEQASLHAPLTVVASDFYGSECSLPDGTSSATGELSPEDTLRVAVDWLKNAPCGR